MPGKAWNAGADVFEEHVFDLQATDGTGKTPISLRSVNQGAELEQAAVNDLSDFTVTELHALLTSLTEMDPARAAIRQEASRRLQSLSQQITELSLLVSQ